MIRSEVCAIGRPGGVREDSCTGGGGAPLVCETGEGTGRFSVVGLVAWGLGCGRKGVPGVYTSVAAAREWIDSCTLRYNCNRL